MKKFEGKTFLMLGTSILAVDAVKYARENGAYTIVTDNLPVERSEAKRFADEILNVSTAETETLIAFCRERRVDGVFAGVSEFNLLQAQKISEALGLRFYFNREQWDRIEKKDQFKALCEANGVNVPKAFFVGTRADFDSFDPAGITFPVIVKPVDGCSSIGISICADRKELERAVKAAFEASGSGRALIEEYIDGHEFAVHYTICNGKAALASVDNRYSLAMHEGNVTTIPMGRVFPSYFKKLFLEKANQGLLSLCESIGLKVGIIFVQGMFDEKKQVFYAFEAGLRSAGEAPCRFLEKLTGQNQFYMLIDYILLGKTDYDLSREDPMLEGHCCALIAFGTPGGTVARIDGFEEALARHPEIVRYERRYSVGDTIPVGDTLKQIFLRFVIICRDRDDLARIIRDLNEELHAIDTEGQEMLRSLDPERIYRLS
ncbi:MAG: ATP-grasp domain-containing protein [Clostridia bacterium]|nr:ATP-grasp domain-containing protein [Clostridia bacterium]